MTDLIRIELLKLRTTYGLLITVAITIGLSIVASVSTVILAGRNGSPAAGTHDNATKVFNQPSAIACTAMFVLGVLAVAGEYRYRTIVATFLAEPRRGRVVAARLAALAGVGAGTAAVAYAITLAVALPVFAARGVHHIPIDVGRLWLGTIVGGACYGLLGVALGALTRNSVAAIVGGLIWIQVVEVALLQNALPALGRWLPTGAAVALTSTDSSTHLLRPAVAALVLVGWALVIAVVATNLTARREVR